MRYQHADGGYTRAVFDENLWGVYVRGADDWYASASRAAAEEHAHALNTSLLRNYEKRGRHGFDPVCWAIPDYWPLGADAHAHELARQHLEQAKRPEAAA